MKKTMFITSVIMVVVMAIALTTSSLAWFTAAGSATVTTTALSITAKGETSTGIQISVTGAGENFRDQVTFVADSGFTGANNANMNPLVPLSGESSNITLPDAIDAIRAGSFMGNYTANGVISSISESANTYFAYGDQDGENGLDPTAGSKTPYTTGYFVDKFWIANLASGDGAAAVYVQPAITLYKYDKTLNSNAGGYAEYTTRGDNDPYFYVAILAKEDGSEAQEEVAAAYSSTKENQADASGWTLVQLFSNAGTYAGGSTEADLKSNWVVNSLSVGKTSASFASGQVASSSYVSLTSIPKINSGKNLVALPAAEAGASRGTATEFRVVAWYDGDTLNNNNSTDAKFQFALTFYSSAN